VFIIIVSLAGFGLVPTNYLDHRQLGEILALGTVMWTFRSSNVLKICKKTDKILHGMLICEIARYIELDFGHTLSCTLPKGSGSVTINLIRKNKPTEAQRLEFNPEKSIEVPIVFRSQ
jgi:hypothetical protein